jgi:CheY-like chemotaxis protein
LDIQMPIMDGMQTIKIIREWQSKREIDLSRT